ncbi:hypothetical protein AAGG74_16325 [Bacillus mexicanus]|uniref:hypothetical protein n=1 Tax=Bacillus mexicanus TaxID=2834415 RepID=UPI003D1AD6C6
MDRKLVVEKFEKILKRTIEGPEILEQILSEEFQANLRNQNDAQIAFDMLDSSLKGLISEYFCYTLTDPEHSWTVTIGEEFKGGNLNDYLSSFKEHYSENFISLNDMTSKLENQILKDMSNSGCDCKSALAMILEEDLGLEGIFSISGADAEPRIEFIS